jgi:hypothetical protein
MKEKPRISRRSNTLPPVPTFTISPAMRCFHCEASSPRVICGELATRRRRGEFWFDDSFFCDAHARPTDEPISGECIFHRFRFNADIIIAGCSLKPDLAYDEALRRLEAAIAAVGGILDVQMCGKQFGRYSPASERRQNGTHTEPPST